MYRSSSSSDCAQSAVVWRRYSVNAFLFCQGRWQSQMQQLRDMGIQDEELMLRALQATDGDIQAALELIFAGGPGLWGPDPTDKGFIEERAQRSFPCCCDDKWCILTCFSPCFQFHVSHTIHFHLYKVNKGFIHIYVMFVFNKCVDAYILISLACLYLNGHICCKCLWLLQSV